MNSSEFRFPSLPTQVCELLRSEIAEGTWHEWLPAERNLTESLHVSRKTLRKALALLRKEGLIETIHGQGNRIIRKPSAVDHHVQTRMTVGLLMPDPLESMRPFSSLWVNHLKTLLAENNILLRISVGRKYFSGHPGRALERLVIQYPAKCWLLANSNREAQAWFEMRGLPCVVAGTCHEGISLPSVDIDHYALCRHAAGVLLAAGHRAIALLHQRTDRAGDLVSESGFRAGVMESPHKDADAVTVTHDASPDKICQIMDRLLRRKNPPTALFVSSAESYLTVMSFLAQKGVRVPQDISLLCRDDDPFLRALVPIPGRYHSSPVSFGKKLLNPLLQAILKDEVPSQQALMMPSYQKGASVARI